MVNKKTKKKVKKVIEVVKDDNVKEFDEEIFEEYSGKFTSAWNKAESDTEQALLNLITYHYKTQPRRYVANFFSTLEMMRKTIAPDIPNKSEVVESQ